jgi:chromosome segregation ATPase
MKKEIIYPTKVQTRLSDDMLTYLTTFSGKNQAEMLRNVLTSHSMLKRDIKLLKTDIAMLEAREEALMTEAKGNFDELQHYKSVNKQAVEEISKRIEKNAELEIRLQGQQSKIKSLTETVQQCHEIDAKHVRMIGELQSNISFVKVAMWIGWFIVGILTVNLFI